jgi:hypothetical protein
MFEHATRPPSQRGARTLPDSVRDFLFESERRVLWHCQKLLAHEDLPGDDRRRLFRLAEQAQRESKRLAGGSEYQNTLRGIR